jgi:hypothetical protein
MGFVAFWTRGVHIAGQALPLDTLMKEVSVARIMVGSLLRADNAWISLASQQIANLRIAFVKRATQWKSWVGWCSPT